MKFSGGRSFDQKSEGYGATVLLLFFLKLQVK